MQLVWAGVKIVYILGDRGNSNISLPFRVGSSNTLRLCHSLSQTFGHTVRIVVLVVPFWASMVSFRNGWGGGGCKLPFVFLFHGLHLYKKDCSTSCVLEHSGLEGSLKAVLYLVCVNNVFAGLVEHCKDIRCLLNSTACISFAVVENVTL